MAKYIIETRSPEEEQRVRELLNAGELHIAQVTDPRILYPELYTTYSLDEQEQRKKAIDSVIGKGDKKAAQALKERIYKNRDESL